LLLATLTLSTIGDEISLITLMFRTAGDDMPFAVPMLLVAQLLPGLLATPLIGRLVDRRDAGRILAAAAVARPSSASSTAVLKTAPPAGAAPPT